MRRVAADVGSATGCPVGGPAAPVSAPPDPAPDKCLHTWKQRLECCCSGDDPWPHKSYWRWPPCHPVPDIERTPFRLEVSLSQRIPPHRALCGGFVRKRSCVSSNENKSSCNFSYTLLEPLCQTAACCCSSVCSDLTEPLGISYSRGDMHCTIIEAGRFSSPTRALREVMSKPFCAPCPPYPPLPPATALSLLLGISAPV